MMPGQWIAHVGERLLHADTYALMLAPSIADLQFEAPVTGAIRPRHYLGVLKAFAGALCFDLACDVTSLTHDLEMIVMLTVRQTCYYGGMLTLLSGLGTGNIATVDVHAPDVARAISYIVVLCGACVITTSLCFWPSRRRTDPDQAA